DATSAYQLGFFYEYGIGIERDESEALRWYRQAAEAGHAAGQYALGAMLARDTGAKPDYGAALFWMTLSLGGRNSATSSEAEAQHRHARELVIKKLSEAEIAEVMRRVEIWRSAGAVKEVGVGLSAALLP